MATNPTLLSMALCKDADKNTIPQTDAGTSGLFSEQYGWQAINSLPLSAGGIAPNRRDFNGAFNLLGNILYYTQKGWVFIYDDTQEYFEGCMVKDPTDGLLYDCISDVNAGQGEPHTNTTNWALHKAGLGREVIPAFNTRDVITTSGTYTAPVDGWYKITEKGGGAGGRGGSHQGNTNALGGHGGGEGGTTIQYVQMTAGNTATVVIGGGGTGGAAGGTNGANGGDTTVTIDGNTYTAGGGQGDGAGGTGTIMGCAGGSDIVDTGGYTAVTHFGANGGGAGGGQGTTTAGTNGVTGGGGAGGGVSTGGTNYAGGNGGDGYVWFEYFATI